MRTGASARPRWHGLRKPLVVALASGGLALAPSGPTSAALSLSTQQIFNFDFTDPAQPPGGEPPYDSVLLQVFLSGATGSLALEIFPDLNGGGSSSTLGPYAVGSVPVAYGFGLSQPGVLDGKFSVGLQSSTLLLDQVTAGACKDGCNFETGPIAGRLVSVPEPGSLALIGIAVAGFAAARRKRRS